MYKFLSGAYWIILSVSTLLGACILIFPGLCFAEIKDIYSITLSFYYAIIGFFIAFIIFVVQYISTKLNSEEVEQLPISNIASVVTIIILFLIILFNVFGQTFNLKQPFMFFSLFLFCISILLILLNLFMAIWMLNISNILSLAADNTVQWLKRKIAFKTNQFLGGPVALADHVIHRLNKDISTNLRIANSAIIANNRRVFVTTLHNIEKIIAAYLFQSRHMICTDDSILTELDDSYNFCIDEALSARNEKFLEDLATSIDVILKITITHRRTIGDRQVFINPWLETLKQLFIKSFGKKRTKVCHQCLEFIDNSSRQLLANQTYRAFEETNGVLYDLADSLSATNSYWSAILLQSIIVKLRNQFIYLAVYYAKSKENLNTEYLSNQITRISKIINKAKVTYTGVGGSSVLFASLYGLESFVLALTTNGAFSSANEIFPARLIQILLDFNKDILSVAPDKNDYRVYDVYPELLYVSFKYSRISRSHEISLAKYASDHILGFLANLSKKPESKFDIPSELTKSILNFYAILIHFNKNNFRPSIRFIHKFIEIYEATIEAGDENRELYRYIKLMACWLSHFVKIRNEHSKIIRTLVAHYREPVDSFPYGLDLEYPTEHINPSEVWYLPPNYLWGNPFQDELNLELNGDGKKYRVFHEFISSKVTQK